MDVGVLHRYRDGKEFGFTVAAVSGGAGREQEQIVGRSLSRSAQPKK